MTKLVCVVHVAASILVVCCATGLHQLDSGLGSGVSALGHVLALTVIHNLSLCGSRCVQTKLQDPSVAVSRSIMVCSYMVGGNSPVKASYGAPKPIHISCRSCSSGREGVPAKHYL